MAQPETKIGELRCELGILPWTPHRHVILKGEICPAGEKLFARHGRQMPELQVGSRPTFSRLGTIVPRPASGA